MIVKFGMKLKWKEYRQSVAVVKALRMTDDFLYETKSGWVQGFRGQWLVDLGEGRRCNMDDESFRRAYQPVETKGEAE